jgi:hypothetical protein
MLAAMSRRRGLWVLGIATAALFVVLAALDLRMQSTGGPGIVGFELAGATERVTQILAEWGQTGQDAARLSLVLDFAFLAAYGGFLALAVLALRDAGRERGWDRYARAGTAIAFLPLVAAACDVAENVGLLVMLEGRGATRIPPLTTAFALAKFVALAIPLAYLLAGLVALTRRHLRWTA